MKIAILGRSNTGKSTLFNVLTNSKNAIVFNCPNVTRDINQGILFNTNHIIFDTAGLNNSKFFKEYTEKSLNIIESSDIILFVVDGTVGVVDEDLNWARKIRKYCKKNILLVVNKIDVKKTCDKNDFYKLGFGDPVFISAEHKIGLNEIYNYVRSKETINEITKEKIDYLKIAILGQPNVGKSTFVNFVLKEKRQVVKDEPGITRDTIKIQTYFCGRNIMIFDTAGLRKKTKVNDDIETISALKTINSIKESDIVILLVDATHDIEKQVLNIAEKVVSEGKILCLALNKWDLVKKEENEKKLLNLKHQFKNSFHQIVNPLILPISAEYGNGISNLFKRVYKLYDISKKEFPTSYLNRILTKLIKQKFPPLSKLKRPMKIKFIYQSGKAPIKFVINVGGASDIPENYTRYLKRGIATILDIEQIPFVLEYKKTENPFTN